MKIISTIILTGLSLTTLSLPATELPLSKHHANNLRMDKLKDRPDGIEKGNKTKSIAKRYIITYKTASTKNMLGNKLSNNLRHSEVLFDGKVVIVNAKRGINSAKILASNSNVLAIEEDQIISIDGLPNDSKFNHQWAHQNTGQDNGTQYADMQTPKAWEVHTGSKDVVIGVIDTGIDYTHNDLKNNLWVNAYEIPGDGYDNDHNGYIDDVNGINAINQSGNPMDDHQHGTHIAGIIGAEGDNEIGVSGVNWKVSLASCKFLDKNGRGYLSNAIRCVNYFVNLKRYNGVNIVALNNSWGGGGYSQALHNAIQYAANYDILFVAAAGNKYNNNDKKPSYPASYDASNVLTVASSDRNDLLSHFSNYGKSSVHMAAPGSGIYSTFPNNQYGWISGTSMSTAQVSGAVGLAKAVNPSLSTNELKEILIKSGDLISDFEFLTNSSKRLNVARTVEYANPETNFDIRAIDNKFNIIAGETAVLNFSIDTFKGWNSPLKVSIESSLVGATAYSTNLTPSGEFIPSANTVESVDLFGADSLQVLVPTSGLTLPGTYSLTIALQNGVYVDSITSEILVLPQGMSKAQLSNDNIIEIADKSPSGIYSEIEVIASGFLVDASVSVDITHPFIKDLEVSLVSPDNVIHPLHQREGGSSDDIVKTYHLGGLSNLEIAGMWRLFVADHGRGDIGTLNQWTLELDSVNSLTPNRTTDVNVSIPDNDPSGMLNVFYINEHVNADQINIPLHIEHPFIGDLAVTLVSPSGTELSLHNREGGGQDNIQQVFKTSAFSGEDAFGLWILKVSDSGRDDSGVLKSWSVQLEGSANQITKSNQTKLEIPDHNSDGAYNTVQIAAIGTIATAIVDIDVTHPYIGDLILILVAPSGKEFTLHNRSGGSTDDIIKTISLDQVANESINGEWKLKAVDKGRGDIGHVNQWSITIQKH